MALEIEDPVETCLFTYKKHTAGHPATYTELNKYARPWLP